MCRNLFVFLVLSVFYLRVDSMATPCQEPDMFLCKSGQCILSSFRCDGENECTDGSDEEQCHGYEPTFSLVQCATDEFQCSKHYCIPIEKFCDAKTDCPDGNDEYPNCVKDLKCDTFRCDDGYCVRNEWVCDGVPDCPDKSDEIKCGNKTVPPEECNNEIDRYLCKNQRCIFLNATCNEKDDCGDNSDENADECKKADSSCKQTAKCEHYCRKTPEGAQCSCRLGYQLSNNRTCSDVNECEIYGICDQECVNSAGSYTCSCHSDYTLNDDRKTCKAEGGEATMVFSIKSEIRGFYLNSKLYYPITHNLQHAVAVSLDANYVYWSDIENGDEAIIKSLEDGSQREVIVTTGLNSPDDIAVDWVTGNVYFTDSGFMHIGVCSNDGFYCTIIIKNRSDKPRGLAVLPSNGLMYWTEWGLNSRILMASMDGTNSSVLVAESLKWPNSLSIDYANKRLYWIDSKLKIIESIRLDGTDRRIVLKGVAKKPFSLAVFENKIYWSDWISNTIQSCDKFTGKDWELLVTANNTIYGMHIYHSVLKPKMPNPCNSNPCSQLCLLNSESKYTCACTLDKELNSDQHTCRTIRKNIHLVIAAKNTFIDYHHQLLGRPKMTPTVTLKHVTAITYNPLTGGLLASDQLTDNIFQFDTNTGSLKNILSIKNEILGGMDFDYIGNNLYLSDIKQKTIQVHSLTTNQKTVFYFQDEPYDIALVPEKSVMFVVFRVNEKYRIDRMKMHGIGPRVPVEGAKTPLFGPKVSLSYDRDLKRLYWSDQGTGRIGSAPISGSETNIFRTGLAEPVSLVVLGDYVFWTQYKSKQLHWTSKSDIHQKQKRIALQTPKDSDRLLLIGLHGAYANEHECRKNNGNCSHVCLLSNLRSHICACPPDMMLSEDNRTCIAQTACESGEVKCREHDKCIKLHQRCDGVQDCPNGEDESDVCDELQLSNCAKDQFQCHNGECVNKEAVCNSHYDCTDRSDEQDCDKKECNSKEFECHEGTCISKYLVCDGQPDCSDFSDEVNCEIHTCDTGSFACESKKCIPETWQCDGEVDCPDGSDESETCQRISCPSEMFTCHNGRCIDSSLKCNAVDDCEDNSDEQYCVEGSTSTFANCTADEYKCYNTEMCLSKTVRCNGVQDCPKNDDERNCARCQKGEYVCDNRKCIDESWVCDTYNDCGDGSDERDCDGSIAKIIGVSNISNCKEFRCSNGVCLPFDKVCDGIIDCPDRSDEFGECTTSCTKDNPCENVCYKTPLGSACGCRIGYQLSRDFRSCEDINECEHNACPQSCRNTDGSFTCSCYEGYVLRSDKISCKVAGPQMKIITVAGNDIRKLSPSLDSIQVVYEELNTEISGIDVNANEGSIYWSNDELGMISKVHLESREQMLVTGLGRPEALAVDWITDNVYFTDNDHQSSIKVCNLDQQRCATVVTIGARIKAMSISVDPKRGLLFWSETSWIEYDRPTSSIYRSSTAGSNATKIVSRNVGIVYAITIDHTRSRLYWSDTLLKTIESSYFDGSDRMIFMKTGVYQALSMNIYEDSIYWLVGTTSMLKKCKLFGDKSCSSISIGKSNIDNHFAILHPSRQPIGKNTCEGHKCDYMCVLNGNNSLCICHDGHPKDSKGLCTEAINSRIKFNSRSTRSDKSTRQQNGALIGVIVTLLVCVIGISGYFYYRKTKPSFLKQNSLSIHFQNPSYDRRDEMASLCYTSGLPPGEHEYVNPVADMTKYKKLVIENNEKPIISIDSDLSDNEIEDSECKSNIRLIY
ncbi:vitellogenin receptor isoform X2 [Hylaeus volcanicus]|uniref:vitellogenin receptor isoform X2 n=1 Tax=Hylaeus volcanicus TaxID=313075 RepID=UPI0023B7FD6F|nr:vitellogenin receptor isoform X2 [Hylaeus volcanicus]